MRMKIKASGIINSVKFFVAIMIFSPIYLIGLVVPRSRHIWVFGSFGGRLYSDNAKELFKWVYEHKKDEIKPYWITKDKRVLQYLRNGSFPCAYAYSFAGLYLTLRANSYIYTHTSSDINFWTGGGARKINLWHGSAIKKIHRDVEAPASIEARVFSARGLGHLRYRLFKPGYFETPDLIFAASGCVAKNLKSSHNVKDSQICISGYPRNDRLFDRDGYPQEGNVEIDKRMVLYLPTFRERSDSNVALLKLIASAAGLPELLFIVKQHPASHLDHKIDLPKNVSIVNSEFDTYELMRRSCALITDYSSVALDYLLLDRPILYFCYDYDDYVVNERGFYFDFNDVTGGKVVMDVDELFEALVLQVIDGHDQYRDVRHRVMEKFNAKISGTYCEDAYTKIREH